MLKVNLVALCLCILSVSHAAEDTRAYRYVDGNGQVMYSQVPPVNGQPSQQVNIRPAQSGRGGAVMPYNEPMPHFFNPGPYGSRYGSPNTVTASNAREQQLANLKAQCVANRGTDCSNPQALQYLQNSQLPRGGVVVIRNR